MGYLWRQTQGWIDCRPLEFRKNKNLPKPALTCSKKCIYNFYCKIELANMTLLERVQNIRITLQKPYHFFDLLPDKDILLVLEDDDGKRFTFRGGSMIESIKVAEKYINQEKEMGGLRIKNEDIEEEKNEEETQKENEEKTQENIEESEKEESIKKEKTQ